MNIIRFSSVLLLSSLLLTGCNGGKEAKKRLEEARSLYESKQFSTAKSVIDSINTLYPREVAVRKEALTLMRLAERGESERIIAYCDSVLPVCLDRVEDLKKGFVFEKDTAYDKTGHYIRQTMTVERNVERSYIRCGVNEEGEMYMASVYFGAKPIGHSGLRLSTAGGAVAETPSIPCDGGLNYRFNDLGNTTEVVSYKGEHCKTVANLVCITGEKERIKAEYTGGKPYVLYLSDSDKKAVRATYELAMVLSEINAMQKAKSLSEKKIRLIDAKLQ